MISNPLLNRILCNETFLKWKEEKQKTKKYFSSSYCFQLYVQIFDFFDLIPFDDGKKKKLQKVFGEMWETCKRIMAYTIYSEPFEIYL